MPPLPSHFRDFAITTVTVIHNAGTEDEERFEAEAHIQAKAAFFAVDTPIYEGDVVEFPDPRGGLARKVAARVDVNNPAASAFRGMEHIHVTWEQRHRPVAPVRRLSVENLHAEVIRSSSDLFADGHYEASVSEAFKSIEVRVRTLTGSIQSGVKLMGEAFSGPKPRVSVANAVGQSGKDEQEGFAASSVDRCSEFGIRWRTISSSRRILKQALEYLGFASLLHRQLDSAKVT